jgi:hypothetical protein
MGGVGLDGSCCSASRMVGSTAGGLNRDVNLDAFALVGLAEAGSLFCSSATSDGFVSGTCADAFQSPKNLSIELSDMPPSSLPNASPSSALVSVSCLSASKTSFLASFGSPDGVEPAFILSFHR